MPAGRVESLDRGDLLARRLRHRRLARANGLTVEVHGARAALRDAASELRARQLQPLADYPQEGRPRIDVDGVRLAVDQQCRHARAPFFGGKGNDVAGRPAPNRRPARPSPPPTLHPAPAGAARRPGPRPARPTPPPAPAMKRPATAPPNPPAEVEARQEGDEHRERVQTGRPADEIRSEQLALDGLTSDHHDQSEARLDKAVVES